MEKFVLISEPRSGTTFFNSVVGRHPAIRTFGEIMPGYRREQDFHNFWLKQIDKDPGHILLNRFRDVFSDYLRYLPSLCPEAACLGLDVKYFQLRWKIEMLEAMHRNGYRVVHLIRKNILKRHVSLALHQPEIRNQIDRASHTSASGQQPKIAMPTGDKLLQALTGSVQTLNEYSEMLNGNFACLELVFEDILDEENNSIRQPVLDRLFRFLRVDPAEQPVSPMKKLNPKRLRHSVSNYCDVVETLTGTGFQWMLDDPERDPALIPAYAALELGELLLLDGQPEKAMEAMTAAAQLAPDLPDPVYLLGLIQLGYGHPASGVETLKRGLAMTLGRPGHAYFDTMLRTTPMDASSRTLVDLLLRENETN